MSMAPIVWALAGALIAETPMESPAGLAAKAADAFCQGRIQEARTLYENALLHQERHGPSLAGLGRIERMEHQWRLASQHLAQAYQADPDDPQVVREFSAAATDPALELTLLERLTRLPRTSPLDRAQALSRLRLRRQLGPRIVNRLASEYRPYQLRMPSAQNPEGRMHGWVLRVSLNGRPPLRLLLDSGARSLLVSQQTAARIGLERLSDSQVGGFGSDGQNDSATVYVADKLVVDGQLALANVLVEAAQQNFVEGIDGLIGLDLFRHFLITCDGRRHQFVLTPFAGHTGEEGAGDRPWAQSAPPPLAEDFVRFRRLGHLLVLEDRLQSNAQYILDTGASYSIVHDSSPAVGARTVSLVGASGTTTATRHEHPLRFHLSAKPTWTREVIGMDLSDMSQYFGVRITGLLGFPVWRDQALTLDPRNGSLRISRR